MSLAEVAAVPYSRPLTAGIEDGAPGGAATAAVAGMSMHGTKFGFRMRLFFWAGCGKGSLTFAFSVTVRNGPEWSSAQSRIDGVVTS
jgi:hypothetical protein